MRKLALCTMLAISMLAVACYSATVTFEWEYDAEQQVLLGETGGFRLYQSKTAGIYGAVPAATVTASERTVTITVEAGTYYWTATAFDGNGNESDRSNEVSATIKVWKPRNLTITVK